MPEVTVAIPVRDGGQLFLEVLDALSGQTVEHELLVCDSGSSDGSLQAALAHGARVLEIPPQSFSHGEVRNRLVREARGAHVALLTQDAKPADERWLERLLAGFAVEGGVAMVYGPYVPQPDATVAVRHELERWFHSLSPLGAPRVDRLKADERDLPAAALIGRRGFFTDANACISREAWTEVPFRSVPYAEDRLLAIDMLRAGYAKVFVPDAAVVHSHRYGTVGQLRRSFDEGRGVREVYGWREPMRLSRVLAQVRGELAYARRELSQGSASPLHRGATVLAVSRHHLARLAGAILGSRADMLPRRVRGRLSLEGRASFVPLKLDGPRGRSADDNRG